MAEASVLSYVYVAISGLLLAVIVFKLRKNTHKFTFNNKIRKIKEMNFAKKYPIITKILDVFTEYYPPSLPIAVVLLLLGLSQLFLSFAPEHPLAHYTFRIGLFIAFWGFALGLLTTINYNLRLKKIVKRISDLESNIIKKQFQKVETVVNNNSNTKTILIAAIFSGVLGAGFTGIPLYQQIGYVESQVIEAQKTTEILNQTLQVVKQSLTVTEQALEKKADIFIHIDPISHQAHSQKALALITPSGTEIKATKFTNDEIVLIENNTAQFDIYISNTGNAVAFIDSYSVSIINNNRDPPFGHSDLGNEIKKVLKPDGETLKILYNVTVTEDMSPFGEIEVFVTYNNNERANADRLPYFYGITSDEMLEVRKPKNSQSADIIR